MPRVYVIPPLPFRPADGHKGTFKRVLVVGGSQEMLGAPVFASTAVLRVGAGLVQFALHKQLLPNALMLFPEAIGHALDERSDRRLLADADKADALVVGPGMGVTPASRRRMLALLKLDKPTVIDADALTLLSREKRQPKRSAPLILTPHPVEMTRLGKNFGNEKIATTDHGRLAIARQASEFYRATIVLKGARTVVTDGTRDFVNLVADSSLGKAGTGDVLAGTTGTLLAQMGDAFEAAQLAVYLHGQAGVLAGQELGPRSVLARDVLDHLSAAIRGHGG